MATTNLTVPIVRQPWTPPPNYDEIRAEARRWIEVILADPYMPLALRRRRVDMELWTFTEIKNTPSVKYRLRYRTAAVLGDAAVEIRHEHVVPRRWLRDQVIEHPGNLDVVLGLAVSCVATNAEDKALTKLGDGPFGWARYQALDLAVIDTKTMKPADLDALVAEQQVQVAALKLD